MSRTMRFPVENNSSIHFDSVQLSGLDNNNKNILAVLVKKTYAISPNGTCQADGVEQVPLNHNPQFAEDNELMIHDTDLYFSKKFSDLVVLGTINSKSNAKQIQVGVHVSGQKEQLSLNVFGKRQAWLNNYKKIQFSEPEELGAIPLDYTHAYGGVDHIAEQKFDEENKALSDILPGFDWRSASPYRYPRNPCGKGFLVENNLDKIANVELPNIEDPKAPLTPSNLIVGKPENWIYQPLARGTSWVNPTWFPRFAYFGVVPDFDRKATLMQIPEFIQRLADPDVLSNKKIAERFSHKAANGASLGLQFPLLTGNETIRLTNIHPDKPDFVLQLPNDRPGIWVDGRKGKLLLTNPAIQSVIIEADKKRVSIVWGGNAPALRPYATEELKTMPYQVQW
jgi:hypothetical protein